MFYINIIKKDRTVEEYKPQKIKEAVNKAAQRAMVKLNEQDHQIICDNVIAEIKKQKLEDIPVAEMHNIVECVLEKFNPQIAKSYKDYRNYKKDFIHMMDDVYTKSQSIRFIGDKENSNTDSALVATKRCLVFNELNKNLYRRFFMTKDELQACKEGYIYIHDQAARLDTLNCCLFDAGSVMSGGFEMGNIWYNEPKTLDTAFDVLGDIILATASQQYGGFTIPEIDKILAPYAEKSYEKYIEEYKNIIYDLTENVFFDKKLIDDYATNKVKRDFEQGFQGIEYKLNTVGSSRGDYPFVTMTFGLGTERFEKMASITFLEVHMKGQGKEGNKKPVLFPKLVFLYDESIHGEGCINEDVFEAGVKCSAKTMYPDWLSLSGKGYVPEMYQKYGRVVSPMGCVDGKELVTYRFRGTLYVENFERMWDRLSNHFQIKEQIQGVSDNLYFDTIKDEVEIYDTKNGFVKVNKVIRNKTKEWVRIKFTHDKQIVCTKDHPFPTVNRGRVMADDLKHGDIITISSREYITIFYGNDAIEPFYQEANFLKKETFDLDGYSYDVETTSDYFEVSGILSHNCRAFLSAWYERGGITPADELDVPIFVGRFNIGAVSLHLPMILAKARRENKDFYEVLDFYLEMIRGVHKRTYEYLGELRASINPVAFCEGGFYGGHLKPHEKIKPLLKAMTASFGITALNELQQLYNQKSIAEDGQFAQEVLEYINKKVAQFKAEDGWLYAIYGTPAESLCGLQVEQFRKQFGIIENVSDRDYVSNSFHCHVTEDLTPIEKQDKEERYWNLCNGGKIQYVRYPIPYNYEAIKTLIRRAMAMGFYEGVNLSLAYCDECGHEELEMDICPICGSTNLTKIDRMNGYLSYSRVHGDTRLNSAKMAEITERKSM